MRVFLSALAVVLSSLSVAQAMEVNVTASHQQYFPKSEENIYVAINLDAREIVLKTDNTTNRNLSLVLDRSSSMSGDPINHAKQAAVVAYEQVHAEDIISLVSYSSETKIELAPQKNINLAKAKKAIDAISADGYTALYDGVQQGGTQVKKFYDPQYVNRVVLLSDGFANRGPSSAQELEQLGRNLAKDGITVTTIGLGLDYDEDLMAKLAHAADGNHYYVRNSRDLSDVFSQELEAAANIYANDIQLRVRMPKDLAAKEFLNYEGDVSAALAVLNLRQLPAGKERMLILEIDPQELTQDTEIQVEASWVEAQTGKKQKTNIVVPIRVAADAETHVINEAIYAEAEVQQQWQALEETSLALQEGRYQEAYEMINKMEENILSNAFAPQEIKDQVSGYKQQFDSQGTFDADGNLEEMSMEDSKSMSKELRFYGNSQKKNIK